MDAGRVDCDSDIFACWWNESKRTMKAKIARPLRGQCTTMDHIYPCLQSSKHPSGWAVISGTRCYCGQRVWQVSSVPKRLTVIIERRRR